MILPDYLTIKLDNIRLIKPIVIKKIPRTYPQMGLHFVGFKEELPKQDEEMERLELVEPNYVTLLELNNFNLKLYEEKRKYTIPAGKEIYLTSGRYNTGKINSNVLDSLYASAVRTNTDPWTALGIAGRETTLGIARRQGNSNSIHHSDLVSNWQLFKTIYLTNKLRKTYFEIMEKIKKGLANDKEIELFKKYNSKLRQEYNSVRPITENPLDNFFKKYGNRSENPNPGDSAYWNKIDEEIKLLKADQAILKWLKTKLRSNGL